MVDPNDSFPQLVPFMILNTSQLAAVHALLGGVSGNAVSVTTKAPATETGAGTKTSNEAVQSSASPAAEQSSASGAAEASPPATDGVVDAHGHPWDENLHASTKTQTKEGLWRMKVGVTRPEPLPGFPKETPATGTSSGTASTTATSETATAAASAPAATVDEDDEFAAFAAAAAKADAADAAAAASVPARKWTDADLGTLCNQAAVKLGDSTPIKELIGKFVDEGTVAHSRNIPEAKREEFAKAVEAKAGIEFAG